MCYTGIETDGKVIYEITKDAMFQQSKLIDDEVSHGIYKKFLSKRVNDFTIYMGCRPVGCDFISALSYAKKFYLLGTDSTSETVYYKAIAYGKGAQRARTELEKLDLELLDLQSAVDNAVRIIYKSYDPLKDKEFRIQMSFIDVATDFKARKVEQDVIDSFVEKYKDLSVDE
ncbi:hypothetical protein EDEG_00886 [Edhazardia aedis USNM 41457]|uniref:Proteasome alpha-type subunits domain-containing protein n=1 Tax=Edhazardia aedis (strain USNM 41457) TaxID=1003232 RepID=J9DB71_EDHAE|nr:hypothetical protein EDEG_00886 [Edhazardia aedis USNM 41457]|eukprot:EJW05006.1 hypothetical protein EDEG_00886 [Edhazardia aedis USNM 41457]